MRLSDTPDPATALLEVLVNSAVRDAEAFGGFCFLKIKVPDVTRMEQIEEGELPADWPQHPELTRDWGDRWLREARSAVLLVRSVLVPETLNVLINPRHADAASLVRLPSFPYPLDPSLFAAAPAG